MKTLHMFMAALFVTFVGSSMAMNIQAYRDLCKKQDEILDEIVKFKQDFPVSHQEWLNIMYGDSQKNLFIADLHENSLGAEIARVVATTFLLGKIEQLRELDKQKELILKTRHQIKSKL